MNNTNRLLIESWKQFDWLTLSLVLALVILGICFQFSLRDTIDYGPFAQKQDTFIQHLIHAGVGLFLGVLTFCFYTNRIQEYAAKLLILAFAILLYTNVFGYNVNGSNRWVVLGFYYIKTLPIILGLFTVYLSALFSNQYKSEKLLSFTSTKCLSLFLTFATLLSFQPDHKAVWLFGFLIITVLLTAHWFKLSIVIILSALLTSIVVLLLSPFRMQRVSVLLLPFEDPLNTGYQLIQSLMAIAGGGLSGVGFQESVMKASLPSAHEGFVLAIIAEELGAIVVLLTLLLSCIIFYRCFILVKRLKANGNIFEALLVMSLSSFFLLFSVANIAVISGTFPAINIPYPFVGYGVSFGVFFAISMGLILRIDANFRQQNATIVDTKTVPKITGSTGNWLLLICIMFMIGSVILNFVNKSMFLDETLKLYKERVEQKENINNSALYTPNFYEQRGKILDRNGRILAVNIEKSDIIINPVTFDTEHQDAIRLLKLLGLPTSKLEDLRLKNKKSIRYVALKRSVDITIAKIVIGFDLEGVQVVPVSRRHYPLDEASITLLGLTDIDNKALSGVEDAHNGALSANQDVRLSIDADIQIQSYETLKQHIYASGAKAGSIIIANTKNGEVLAMTSFPASKPNERSSIEHTTNRAISRGYEPRELFHPFVGLAAERNFKSKGFSQLVNTSPGYINTQIEHFDGIETITYQTNNQKSETPVAQVISSNNEVGLIRLMESLPYGTFKVFIENLGFNKKTALGLNEEDLFSLPNLSDLPEHRRFELALGRGFIVTPIQLLQAYMAIANDGVVNQLSLLPILNIESRHVFDANSAKGMKDLLLLGNTSVWDNPLYGKSASLPLSIMDKEQVFRGQSFSAFVGFTTIKNTDLIILAMIDDPENKQKKDSSQNLATDLLKSIYFFVEQH